MIKVSDLFNVAYGVNFELNAMSLATDGINFVSRTAKNNGVSATVQLIPGVIPIPAGTISVAGGGSVMASFLQTEPYYSGRDLYYLTEKVPMTDNVKLFYCKCLQDNKYRYSYGRQANRTLKDILLPDIHDIPHWVHNSDVSMYDRANTPNTASQITNISSLQWKPFSLSELFDIRKGKRLTKANMIKGETPFIGSTDSNNGVTAYVNVDQSVIHQGNTITVNYDGSVGEAFYQSKPFWALDAVNVLYPNFDNMTPNIALFICTVIRMEKYRFNYGRKWGLERMKSSIIRLPVLATGQPDFVYMEDYIKSLPYSSQI